MCNLVLIRKSVVEHIATESAGQEVLHEPIGTCVTCRRPPTHWPINVSVVCGFNENLNLSSGAQCHYAVFFCGPTVRFEWWIYRLEIHGLEKRLLRWYAFPACLENIATVHVPKWWKMAGYAVRDAVFSPWDRVFVAFTFWGVIIMNLLCKTYVSSWPNGREHRLNSIKIYLTRKIQLMVLPSD